MDLARREYSRILAGADRQQVLELSEIIEKSHTVRGLRPAQKTLTMIKMREPISATLFYLGEALCCECTVEVEGAAGFSVMLGDDFPKVTAAAVIDAAFSAGLTETVELSRRLHALDRRQRELRGRLNGEILKSKVTFDAMGEG